MEGTEGTTPQRDVEKVGSETRSLACPLSRIQIADRGLQLARKQNELKRLKERKKSQAAELKAKIDTVETEIDQLGEAVREEVEQREVECSILHDYTENARRVYRDDSGELLDERALTAEERTPQRALPLNGDPLAGPDGEEDPDELDEDPSEG